VLLYYKEFILHFRRIDMSEEKKEELETKQAVEEKELEPQEAQETKTDTAEQTETKDTHEAQEVQEEQTQETKEFQEVEEPQESISEKPKSYHDELISRIDSSKEMAENIYQEYLNINNELEEKSASLAQQENTIVNTTVTNSLELLKQLQVESLQDEIATINEIKLDNKEQLMSVKYPSKGTFKGLFFGAITALAGVAGAFAFGAKLADLPLNTNTLLQKSSWDKVSEAYSILLNLKQVPYAGYIAVGAVSALLGLIVYKTIKWLQKRKNINYVNSLEKDTKNYIANLEDKNIKTEELIQHIENIKLVMQKYDVILQEQNAKIKRILFIEQPQSVEALQKTSKLEVEKTVLILDELLKLMNTPVSEDVEITDDSSSTLKSANSVINEVIRKLYI